MARKSSNGDESPCNQITCEFGSICIDRIKVLLGKNRGGSTLLPPSYHMSKASPASMKVILPECSCPDKCSHYFTASNSSGIPSLLTPFESNLFVNGQSEDTPVCGSDGIDYPSLCQLKKKSCQDKNIISLKFVGKCGTCVVWCSMLKHVRGWDLAVKSLPPCTLHNPLKHMGMKGNNVVVLFGVSKKSFMLDVSFQRFNLGFPWCLLSFFVQYISLACLS